jgi:TonB family protein
MGLGGTNRWRRLTTKKHRTRRLLGAVLMALASASPARAQAPAAAAAPAPVVAPKLISDTTVAYPERAQGDATVVLTLTINEDGTVRQATPAEVNEPFSMDAVSAALGWRFEPAMRGGVPISAKIRVEVVFREPRKPAEEPEAPEAPPVAATPEKPAPSKPLEVEVRGERAEPSRTVTLSRAEVRQIPGTFGDPFRAIEIMPGVTPIVSGLPFFFIRGAPPGDVGYFLDGIRVPLLFHVGVGPSVIHPGIMERVDLYPGGYPARFGRYSGGVVAGETTKPMPELRGEYNVRLFDVGALAEVPFANGRGTVLAGGRYSYTAAMLSLLQSNTVLDYWDYQTRATYDLTSRDTIGAFAFGSYDYLGAKTSGQTLTLFGAEFHRLDLRYDHHFGPDRDIRVAVTGGIDKTRLPDDRYLRDRLVGARTELKYKIVPGALLRAGMDIQLDSYDVELGTSQLNTAAQSVSSLFPTRTDIGITGRADAVFTLGPGVEMTPGARLDFYESEGVRALALDPRLAVRLEMTKDTHLLSAIGVASQAPAFVVPLPGFQPGGLNGGLQRALQQSFGVEVDLGQNTIATATAFHNGFFNMSDPLGATQASVGGCPPGSFPDETLPGDRISQPQGTRGGCRDARTIARDRGHVLAEGGIATGGSAEGLSQVASALEKRTMGRAYGFELFVKRRLTSRIGGFLSYTLSRSTRLFENKEYVARFDRTHVINAAIAYDLGRNWRAGTRIVFYTGLPKAPDPTDSSSTRLPPFFRVDLRLEKRWRLGERAWISGVAEWMNATLSKETVGTTCTLQGCESQTVGPITIPSLGIEGGF